jgi:RNA polymerase sigma-70 factor (ECF subfamily)
VKVAARSGDTGGVGVPSPSLAIADAPALDLDLLYAEHAGFLGRVLVRLVGDGAHVDDLLQETFVIAFRRRGSFDGSSSPRTWLYGIAIRVAMRHRRSAGRWLRALAGFTAEPRVETAAAPDADVERARARALVRDALDRLPFKQREVLALYELEELDGQQIAALLDIPIGTVWTRLHHARRRFEDVVRRRLGRTS